MTFLTLRSGADTDALRVGGRRYVLLHPPLGVVEVFVDVRIWGVVEDRLIEICAGGVAADEAFRIAGLAEDRARTTADRVRAALLNSGVLEEMPAIEIRSEPVVNAGRTSDLDLAFAVAVLAWTGIIGKGLRSVLATGRLGLNGTVYQKDLPEPALLIDVVESLCRSLDVDSEHMFEEEARRG